MNDCIFCKIAKKEIPAQTVFENKDVIAFLDVNPVTKGHILVIPKEHYADVFDIPEEILKEIAVVAKKLSQQCKKKLPCDGVNILNASGKEAQQSVFHFHMHVVPRYADEKLNLWFHNEAYTPSKEELSQVQKLLTTG